MKLSELHTGQSGIIVKVTGHGGFRKRIVEMGFIKGQKVDVLLNAPLKDPVKYRVMGYEVSLRHSEANMIEVMTKEEQGTGNEKAETPCLDANECDDELKKEGHKRGACGKPQLRKDVFLQFRLWITRARWQLLWRDRGREGGTRPIQRLHVQHR